MKIASRVTPEDLAACRPRFEHHCHTALVPKLFWWHTICGSHAVTDQITSLTNQIWHNAALKKWLLWGPTEDACTGLDCYAIWF